MKERESTKKKEAERDKKHKERLAVATKAKALKDMEAEEKQLSTGTVQIFNIQATLGSDRVNTITTYDGQSLQEAVRKDLLSPALPFI
eukprot:2677243-Pyramimonas_sp.AAC.1